MRKLRNNKVNNLPNLGQQFGNGNEKIPFHSLNPHHIPVSANLSPVLSSTRRNRDMEK